MEEACRQSFKGRRVPPLISERDEFGNRTGRMIDTTWVVPDESPYWRAAELPSERRRNEGETDRHAVTTSTWIPCEEQVEREDAPRRYLPQVWDHFPNSSDSVSPKGSFGGDEGYSLEGKKFKLFPVDV